MPKPPSNNRRYQLTHLWDRHKEILRLISAGLDDNSIAMQLGVTRAVVSYTRNSELGKRELAILRVARDQGVCNIQKRVLELAEPALNVLETAMKSEDSPWAIKLRAAMDVLNREGTTSGSGTQKVQGEMIHKHLTLADIQEIKQRAKAINSTPVSVEVVND